MTKKKTDLTLPSSKDCERCHTTFTPKKVWHVYCSGKCRRLAWFERTYVKADPPPEFRSSPFKK